MYLESKIIESIDRMGRKFSHKLHVLKCNQCQTQFERRGPKCKNQDRLQHFCSKKCTFAATILGGAIEKTRTKTNLKKFGTKNVFASEHGKQKIKETLLERYGVEHALQFDKFKEKFCQTMLNNHGVEYPGQSPEIQEKCRQTMLNNHGVKYPMQMQSTQDAMQAGCIKKYGVPHAMQSKVFQEHVKQISLKKYGVDWPSKAENVKEKSIETFMKNFGVPNVSQSEYFANLPFSMGCHKSGYVDFHGQQIWFRSSYEERFIEWCNSNQEIIDLECNIPIEYQFEDKTHTYFIDFGVTFKNGEKILYEIKSVFATTWPKNIAKFESAKNICKQIGFSRFEIITEISLKDFGV